MTLSGGQKQRLFIALALINDPELVFLDELTTGLDPQARRAIWDLVRGIRDRGKTVCLTTHLMEEAERLCDRVAVIDRGRIVDIGPPAALVAGATARIGRSSSPPMTRRMTRHCARARRREPDAPDRKSRSAAGRGADLVGDRVRVGASHRVRDFRTMMPTLEDVFLTLTGHSVRE